MTAEPLPLIPYAEALERYGPTIGLETHVELGTRTKLFCGCPAQFGGEPNTQVCPVCLGLPGSLPVPSRTAIEYTIRIGLALNCSIASWCRFARKNYFYPDMPKDYQISQYDEPLCTDGWLDVTLDEGEAEPRHVRVGIERVHLEEDTGKSLHVGGATGRIQGADYSLVDYNRAGIPLVEIVTKPITGTGAAAPVVARTYVAELREVVRSLGVSDVRMEEGSLRCDVNTSLAPRGSAVLGTRTETKNVNSLRSVERAVRSEIERQAAVLDARGKVALETRHFHEDTGITTPGRSKEEAEDYRYFPEPDLVPIATTVAMLAAARSAIGELPSARAERYEQVLGLSADSARLLAFRPELVDYFERAVVAAGPRLAPQIANWLSQLVARIGDQDPGQSRVTPLALATVVELVHGRSLSGAAAREVLDVLVAEGGDPQEIVKQRGLGSLVADDGLAAIVATAIAADQDAAGKVRDGNEKAIGALVGAVMRETRGRADGAEVTRLIREQLEI